jgi:hypothetical protein
MVSEIRARHRSLDNVRNRVVGILLGLLVTAFVFNYIWPECARITPRTAQ